MRHVRAAKFCSAGPREWFPRMGFSWGDFLANGIDAQLLRDTGDAFALKVVRIAEEERDGRG